jgi:hypothetical protein
MPNARPDCRRQTPKQRGGAPKAQGLCRYGNVSLVAAAHNAAMGSGGSGIHNDNAPILCRVWIYWIRWSENPLPTV